MVPVADTRKSARFGPGWTYITPSAWDWHEVWDGEKERTEGAWIELKKLRLLAERSNVCEHYWELGLDGEAEARVVPYIAWPAIEQLPTSNRATAWKRAEDGGWACEACKAPVNPAWRYCPWCGGDAGARIMEKA